MLTNLAIGLLETSSIAKGIEAADAMCKTAQVKLAKTNVIARGKYTILLTGPVGEVESSMRAGIEMVGKTLVHQFIVRNVHEGVMAALDKRVPAGELDAVGIIETKEAVAVIHAADAAAKAAKVHLVEVKAVVGGGKGYVTMIGEVGAVRTAVGAGIAVVPPEQLVTHVVIAQPDEQVFANVGK